MKRTRLQRKQVAEEPIAALSHVELPAGVHPWKASLLHVSTFPLPEIERVNTYRLLSSLRISLTMQHPSQHFLYLQSWKLVNTMGIEILQDNMADWWPTIGSGIWPTRKPPGGLTEETLSDMAAAMFRGEDAQLNSYKILALNEKSQQLSKITEKLHGFGALIEFFTSDSQKQLHSRGRDLFLPAITERRFRNDKFYIPLLDLKELFAVNSAEQIDQWLCGAHTYIRESAEDNAILILSRVELAMTTG